MSWFFCVWQYFLICYLQTLSKNQTNPWMILFISIIVTMLVVHLCLHNVYIYIHTVYTYRTLDLRRVARCASAMSTVAVVGGGIAGVAAARVLCRQGDWLCRGWRDPQMVVKSKGILPKSLNSGLGYIINPESYNIYIYKDYTLGFFGKKGING